ncbi:unnamed protein product [Rotaria magnacalcarata]|uniref:Alpha-L-rhamnosidase concanavalin-like domain-containing protein n=1 Tax=Rotaria magnacalcarata TaxID=392030 RepID=A0A817AGA5_9BILA|nr:unnamed protein product [Rotaria magnacalcarata]CAF2244118.1 unnamed protein product [Rotaria magnacalcarata]
MVNCLILRKILLDGVDDLHSMLQNRLLSNCCATKNFDIHLKKNDIDFTGLYYENLAAIAAIDTVILDGTGNEAFEPLFTYHGFRYLIVHECDNINKDNIECHNAHSETKLTGNFTAMVSDNRLPDSAVRDMVPLTVGFSPADPNCGTPYVTIA